MTVFDDRPCTLGEGPLWHPERQQLFWFDILEQTLMTRTAAGPGSWTFDECVSAAGWVDHDTLLIASETALWTFDLRNGQRERIVPLEADNPVTRSNDGRADPFGGFWIGSMGKEMEPGVGSIHRYYRGELRKLYDGITVSNSICFAPDGGFAHFSDTPTNQVMKQALDADGWPVGAPEVFLDLRADRLNPDGAVIAADGTYWVALWGASQLAAYAPDGKFVQAIDLPARHVTCPAFGGDALSTLYCTSARMGLNEALIADQPTNGMVFSMAVGMAGQPEHRVLL